MVLHFVIISYFAVLFSHIDYRWKLADFGTAAEATSTRLKQTTFGRGTAAYRAPEVVRDIDSGYNTRSDIWAFGCIAYELFTGEKAFKADWETREYRHKCLESPKRVFDESRGWPNGIQVTLTKRLVDLCVNQPLHCDWNARPPAKRIKQSFQRPFQNWSRATLDEVHQSLFPSRNPPGISIESPRIQIPFSYNASNHVDITSYPDIAIHLVVLCTFVRSQNHDRYDLERLIDTLVPRSSVELILLKNRFRKMMGEDLHVALRKTLDINPFVIGQQYLVVKCVLIGLALGPVLYDLWLLRGVSSAPTKQLTEGIRKNQRGRFHRHHSRS